jgi:demethylmenaquinone methyltransferase/2-methoxy-6-polyprenyl-1,4-benzoquinol methylase
MKRLSGKAKAQYVGAMFSRIVPRYDLMNGLMTFGRDGAWRSATASLAAPRPGGVALDIAAGTGDLALALACSPARTRVVALDFCAEMLAEARRKAQTAKAGERIQFVLGDALCLPFPDDSFDCATMGFALRNVADIRQTLAEVRRILRPGGRYANLELTPPVGPLAPLVRLYSHRIVPLLGGLVTGDPEAYTYLPNSVTHFPTASALRAMMKEVGFGEVTYRLLAAGTVAIHCAIKD